MKVSYVIVVFVEVIIAIQIIYIFSTFEECQWSRKQAELFTAQQANLLQINEKKAMAPKQLQKTIMQIINDLPEYPDIVLYFFGFNVHIFNNNFF